jgi:hypothetical protein
MVVIPNRKELRNASQHSMYMTASGAGTQEHFARNAVRIIMKAANVDDL